MIDRRTEGDHVTRLSLLTENRMSTVLSKAGFGNRSLIIA